MQITYKKINEIKPYDNNPRKNKDAIDAVAQSIREFGFKVPIVIDHNHEIVAGHTRYKASLKLGLEEVPCIVADDLSEEQIKAFRLADNKTGELASWDLGMLKIEMEDIEGIDMNLFGFDQIKEKDTEEDDFEIELPAVPKAKLGDVYQLGRHRLVCGDATKKEHWNLLVADGEIDLLVTDPPYNVDYGSKAEAINGYGYHFSDRRIMNDYMPEEQFIQFLDDTFKNTAAAMRQGAGFYIFHASITQLEFETALRLNELKSRQQLIWVKSSIVLGRQDYQWKHEPCLYGWKEGAAHYFIFERTNDTVFESEEIDLDKLKKEELKEMLKQYMQPDQPKTIIRHDKPTRSKEHPTMKPIKLIGELIKNSSRHGWKVLDPFGGSGSTLIASEQLDRTCYMMELDPKFVDVIIKRWEEQTGETAVKL